MKIMTVPTSGKSGGLVYYRGPYGQVVRRFVVPANRGTARQCRPRKNLGASSLAWHTLLTEEQRLEWVRAAAKEERRDRFGNVYSPHGQAFFCEIDSARSCIGRERLFHPPPPVVNHLSPVDQLVISQDGAGLTLKLRVGGPVTEDIMVFGQAPCSPGRMRPRRGIYLGLLPAPVDGWSDITEKYLAAHGVPRDGSKVFIWTRWQVNGREGPDQMTHYIVKAEPAAAGSGKGS